MPKTKTLVWSACLFLKLSVGPTWASKPSWPTFRNGYLNQGISSVNLRPLRHLSAPTASQTKGLIWATPVIDASGVTYFGSADKTLYALESTKHGPNFHSPRLKWSYTLFDRSDSLIDSASAITQDQGMIVIPGGDGFLHAVNLQTGEARWTFEAKGTSSDTHASGTTVNSFEGNVQVGPDGILYAGSDKGYLYAVEPHSGQQKWAFKTRMMIGSSPTIAPNIEWLAFGSGDGHLYLLDPSTGAELDRVKFSGDIKSSPAQSKKGANLLRHKRWNIPFI
jgi:outer membrane protein assembly factor BamB